MSKPDESKPRCPNCRASRYVTRHSVNKRKNGGKYSRWLCRNCGITFIRSKDKARGNYPRRWTR